MADQLVSGSEFTGPKDCRQQQVMGDWKALWYRKNRKDGWNRADPILGIRSLQDISDPSDHPEIRGSSSQQF